MSSQPPPLPSFLDWPTVMNFTRRKEFIYIKPLTAIRMQLVCLLHAQLERKKIFLLEE